MRDSNGTVFRRRLVQFPPILVRLLARHSNGPAMTSAEILARFRQMVPFADDLLLNKISVSTSWAMVPVVFCMGFTVACDVDLLDPKRMRAVETYLGGSKARGAPKFTYLFKSPEWESTLKPLMARYQEHLQPNVRTTKA